MSNMVYGCVGFSDSELFSEIKQVYGSDPVKEDLANQVAMIAGDFSRTNVVGSTERGSAQKRREYRKKARAFITERAKGIPRPVGFIGGFVFMAILSGIISWFVQKLMKKYFESTDEMD